MEAPPNKVERNSASIAKSQLTPPRREEISQRATFPELGEHEFSPNQKLNLAA
jgi:hypothetical protein